MIATATLLPPGSTETVESLRLPIALRWHERTPLVTFGLVPAVALHRPFWSDTVRACTQILGYVPLDGIEADDRELGIAGSVLHVYRCGSTLVMRQFAALPRVACLSEPEIIQSLLEGPPAPRAVTHRRLRRLLAAHRDGLAPVADRLVVKWPGLMGQHASLLREVFPEVPTVFLHRDPVEVLESIRRAPLGSLGGALPRHVAAWRGELGSDRPRDALEFAAAAITGICSAVARVPGLHRLDYTELPSATWERLGPHFGFTMSENARAALTEAARWHSKDVPGDVAFTDDRADKQTVATPRVRELARDLLAPALRTAIGSIPHLSTSCHGRRPQAPA